MTVYVFPSIAEALHDVIFPLMSVSSHSCLYTVAFTVSRPRWMPAAC